MLAASCVEEKEERATPSSEWLEVIGQVAFQATDTEKSLEVTADCHWTVSVSNAWEGLTVTPLEGDNTQLLTITTPGNSTRNDRQAVMTITSKGGISRSVSLTQVMGEVQLTVHGAVHGQNSDSLVFLSTGGMQEFTIESNTTWSISGRPDWMKALTPEQGEGTSRVQVEVPEIQTDQDQTATLVVSAENGAKTGSIVILQRGKVIELTVNPQAVTATATDTEKTFAVVCNADWTATVADDWLTLSPISATQTDRELRVSFEPNHEQRERSTTITISAGTRKSLIVSFTQQAATLPVITSLQAASVERREATFIVGYESQFPVTEYGLCYSQTNSQPTQSDAVVSAQGGKQSEATTLTLTGLESGSTYHVRAYARSVVGLVYSDAVTISTAGSVPGEDDNPMPNPK